MEISYIPLRDSHFPLLLKWFSFPHVKEWWDRDVEWTPEQIAKKYQQYVQGYKRLVLSDRVIKKPMHAYIMCINGKEVGYIQYYNAYDFPREQGYEIESMPESLASLDVFIGEEKWIGKGIGPRLIETFVNTYVFKDFEACFVDPDIANTKAIRAYEKAGFKKMCTVQDGSVLWMVKEREGMSEEGKK